MTTETPPPPPDAATQFGRFQASLRTFRAQFLREGSDFGVIPGTGADARPTLLKPGSEKIARWLGLRPHFEADLDTWAQGGSVPGLFCYLCYLLDDTDAIVGEGRGSAHVDEGHTKYSKVKRERGESLPWTANNAIKYAQKRAQVDAILRYGCLSDEFAQDLEDQEADAAAAYSAAQTPRPPAGAAAPPAAATPSPSTDLPASSASADPDGFPAPAGVREQQVRVIRALLQRLGWDEAAFVAANGGVPLPEQTAVRAQKIIDKLQTRVRENGGQAA